MSISWDTIEMPDDFGIYQRVNSSGLVHASKTRRAGPLKVRVTTISRSDVCSTVVWFFMGSLFLVAGIGLLLAFQFLDDLVELFEARLPELTVTVDPCRDFLKPGRTEPAGANATDLLGGDEPGLFEHAHVLLHAGECHVEGIGEVRDRSVGATEPLEDAASGGIR